MLHKCTTGCGSISRKHVCEKIQGTELLCYHMLDPPLLFCSSIQKQALPFENDWFSPIYSAYCNQIQNIYHMLHCSNELKELLSSWIVYKTDTVFSVWYYWKTGMTCQMYKPIFKNWHCVSVSLTVLASLQALWADWFAPLTLEVCPQIFPKQDCDLREPLGFSEVLNVTLVSCIKLILSFSYLIYSQSKLTSKII